MSCATDSSKKSESDTAGKGKAGGNVGVSKKGAGTGTPFNVITCTIKKDIRTIKIKNTGSSGCKVIYTKFEPALRKIVNPEPGKMGDFLGILQQKLDEKLDGNPPDAPTLIDTILC